MQEKTIDLTKVKIDPSEPIDYSQYDDRQQFTHPDGTMSFTCCTHSSNQRLLHLHDFMPWGMSLDFPLLRDFNACCLGHYDGDITFYAMHGVRFRYQRNQPGNILEQLADKWLEAYISQKDVPHRLAVGGASLGGLFAAVIASRAKRHGLDIGQLYLFEPAGAVKKSLHGAGKQITNDTRYEYNYALSRVRRNALKFKVVKGLFTNFAHERRVLKTILDGGLADYVNAYLTAYPKGKVGVFHGAESTFLSYDDVKDFHHGLTKPNRVFYVHSKGAKHGIGPHFRQHARVLLDTMDQLQTTGRI